MKNLFLSLAALLISASAFAQTAAQNQLINSDERPSPALLLSNPAYMQNYFTGAAQFNASAFLSEVPTMIVGLEKAFPGAKYAFLGRDMDLIADAVEAFYLSIGQKNRVERIRISTPSLQGATPDLITDFLVQLGLDTNPQSHKEPLIMVDYTSFNTSSQSTIITYAVVNELRKRGLPANDILTRFNVASIHSGIQVHTVDTNQTKETISENLKAQNQSFAANSRIDRIIRLPISNIAYGSEWHDRYGPLTRQRDGSVTTTPMAYFPVQSKSMTLLPMIGAIELGSSLGFQNQVTAKAAAAGVYIANLPGLKPPPPPMTEAEKKAHLKAELALLTKNFQDSLNTLSNALPDLGEKYEYNTQKTAQGKMKLTQNGLAVLNALSAPQNFTVPKYLEISLDVLAREYQANKIGARDFRRIFITILENQEITNEKFVATFQASYRKLLPLEIAMGKPDVREKYMELSGMAGVNYKKLASGGALPLSCKFMLLSDAE
jgi:hypothetical protein